jgi:hypothetical protein
VKKNPEIAFLANMRCEQWIGTGESQLAQIPYLPGAHDDCLTVRRLVAPFEVGCFADLDIRGYP